MKRRALTGGAGLAALTVVAVVSASGGNAEAPGQRILKFLEVDRDADYRVVDLPPRSRMREGLPTRASSGDVISFSQPIVDQARRPAGKIFGTCTAAESNRRFDRTLFVCHAVAKLRDGDIALEFASRFPASGHSASVTGGTGAYAGARGIYTSRQNHDTVVLLP